MYAKSDGTKISYSVNRGVPRGSVLGPLQLNITYNGVLTSCEDTRALTIGFADDTLLIVTCQYPWEVEEIANEEICRITEKIVDMGCKFAAQKTAAISVKPGRNLYDFKIQVKDVPVLFSHSFKYLGVMVDNRCGFRDHTEYATAKTEKVIDKLRFVLRNTKGPREMVRRLYYAVTMQVLMYGAPIWAENLTKECEALNRVQRRMNIKVIQGYITVGSETACALSGNPPADLIAREYVRIADRIKNVPGDITPNEALTTKRKIKAEERRRTTMEWQLRWSNKDNWTKHICSEVEHLNRKVYRSTFHTTQLLSGKEVFGEYRMKLKKARNANCFYCDATDDEFTAFAREVMKDQKAEEKRAREGRCSIS